MTSIFWHKVARWASVSALLFLLAMPVRTAVQISQTITLTTGSEYRAAPNRTMANSLMVEVQPGATAVVYVLFCPRPTTCDVSDTTQRVATIGFGTGGQPGGVFTFPSNNDATTQAGGFDVSSWAVSGTTSDTVLVTYDKR